MFKVLKKDASAVKVLPMKESWNCYHPKDVLERDVPTLALRGINRDSVGNYHLMDKESTGIMVIPPGITRS
jgi:hypothetical protein